MTIDSKVIINPFVFKGLCLPWQDALVIKVVGKCINFQMLHDQVTKLWRLVVGFDMVDIGNKYFMVKFDLKEDGIKVIEGDPWMIFYHYLYQHTRAF